MESISLVVTRVVQELYELDVDVQLSRPDAQFGDFATNVAMQLAGRLGRNPREVAEELATELRETNEFTEVNVASPGFINLKISDHNLVELWSQTPQNIYDGQTIVTEYSDPNPFKVLHAGHLYTTLVGDTISRLFEVAGGQVHRTNFGGDVGLHVAKNMWAIVRYLGGELPEQLIDVGGDAHGRAAWLAARYVEGNTAYEEDETFKQEIIDVNKRVYALHETNDHESAFAKLYWTCREWSYEYFAILYDELQVKPFEKYYPESETAPIGLETVRREQINGVYTESNGAVVFDGESQGLHTRVFVTANGLPTYETKDVGLIMKKWQDYHFDRSVVITGNDIMEYMKVVLKSIEQFEPELVKRTIHLTHGNLKLTGGQKMSSRRGNVLLALDVLGAAREAQKELTGENNEVAVLGAVKYSFLSQRIGGDIVYDPKESVSVLGNSGPYLQYAHARGCSILTRAGSEGGIPSDVHFDDAERLLARKLGEYAEVIDKAVAELMPHGICTYLYELSQEFNRFYESSKVVGSDRESLRLALVRQYRDTLARGLGLLGIEAPEKM